MNPFEDIPWSPDEMEDYRRGVVGKTFKRSWSGPSRFELWKLYGHSEHILECPDCGRPCIKWEAERFQLGKCWNCWKENAYPGFHAKAHAYLRGKGFDTEDVPQFKKLKGETP